MIRRYVQVEMHHTNHHSYHGHHSQGIAVRTARILIDLSHRRQHLLTMAGTLVELGTRARSDCSYGCTQLHIRMKQDIERNSCPAVLGQAGFPGSCSAVLVDEKTKRKVESMLAKHYDEQLRMTQATMGRAAGTAEERRAQLRRSQVVCL